MIRSVLLACHVANVSQKGLNLRLLRFRRCRPRRIEFIWSNVLITSPHSRGCFAAVGREDTSNQFLHESFEILLDFSINIGT